MTSEPNILILDKSGTLPDHNSYGVLLFIDVVGERLIIYAAVAVASAQNGLGNLASESIHFALSTKVRFMRSATPFCCGEYGVLVWCLIPC